MRRHATAALSALIPLLCLAACESMSMPWETTTAFVQIDDENGQSVDLEVGSSSSVSSREGIAAFRNEDWEAAVTKLKAAVGADPEDHNSHFALGVAYEQMGDLDKALQHFKRANVTPKKAVVQYDDAVRRVKAKLGM